MFVKQIARSLAVAACLFALSACDDNKKAEQPQESQSTAEQDGIAKYNAHVEAANYVTYSFGEDLAKYKKYNQPQLDGKKPLEELYSSGSSSAMTTLQDFLDKAIAMKPPMPELDQPARDYSDAVAKATPVIRDLENYINSKSYSSDNGAKGRELQPAYLSSMEKLVVAQANYLNAIDAKDRARIKAEFDKAEKDSLAYYRIGSIYYLKESMDAASGFLNGEGLGDKKEAFKTSLDQFNAMMTSYDTKMRERNKVGCSNMIFKANAYLSTGRDVIKHTEEGRYEEEAKRAHPFGMSTNNSINNDTRDLMQNFNNMINTMNLNQC
ncbi:YiiG family protein [Kosakonia cowanii]|nr:MULTISPECIES: YiiG family protein [Kosakonia]MDH2913167.1 YiiG family protein [Kosakonia sp. HypNH10]